MAFKDGNSPSTGAKTALAMFTLIGVIVALMQLFGSERMLLRHGLLISCILIFYIRLVISLFVFIKRKVSWFEGTIVGVLYGMMVVAFSSWGIQINTTSMLWSITGMLLFLLGSYINSLADYQRHVWKMRRENHGRLYTQGLFSYARHINYFGDSAMFVGFAVVTQNMMSFIPVILIILNLLFLQIPQLGGHLKNKYGDEYLDYKRTTKMFIPFLY